MPVLTPLRQALAAGPKGLPEQLAFITLRRGANVCKEHLGAWFSEAAERAGLVDCTAHGIRKAAARRLAEAGATVNQLMAIFGWTRPDMAIKYTREASKKHMAAEAIGGLVRAETENVYSLTAILGAAAGRNRSVINFLGFVWELTRVSKEIEDNRMLIN